MSVAKKRGRAEASQIQGHVTGKKQVDDVVFSKSWVRRSDGHVDTPTLSLPRQYQLRQAKYERV